MQHTLFDTPVLKNLIRWGSIICLKISGWKLEGRLPDKHRFVMIAAPHTSNWDLPITLAIAFVFRLKLFSLGKKEMFRWPFGPIVRWLGVIPVDRSRSGNTVDQSIILFNENDDLVLTIPPEGTRKSVRYWKTGFYYIALGAGVPIVLGYIDYQKKRGGVGPSFIPTGDIDADMNKIREFYSDKKGKYPD